MRLSVAQFVRLQFLLASCLLAGHAVAQQGPRVRTSPAEGPSNPAGQSAASPDTSQRFHQLITRIVTDNIPHEYEEKKDWGKTTEIWAGVKIWREGLRIETKRRKKEVKHGKWRLYRVWLVDPEQQFHVRVENIREVGEGRVEFDASAEAAMGAFGRLSLWERGVQLISISADADARVRLRVRCNLGAEVDPTKLPPDVVLDPAITDADLQLVDFDLRRISDLRGPLVNSLSHAVREVLEDRIANRRQRLVDKINRQIEKNEDEFRLSLHDLLRSKWGEQASKHLDISEEGPSDRGSEGSGVDSARAGDGHEGQGTTRQ